MSKNRLFSISSSFAARYGTVVLLVSGATILTLLIWSLVQPLATPLFLAAIIISAWKKGFGAGIFATLLSGIAIDYFFTEPEFAFGGTILEITRLFIFALEGTVLTWVISARTDAVKEIENSREQLLALSTYQQILLEEERKRIALEIHDELGQCLTGLKMDIHYLNRQIKDACHPGSNHINDKIKDLLHLIDGTIGTVRRIATELRPPILDDLGLIAAIEWQLEEFGRRNCVSCNISSNIENVEVNEKSAIAIFRIFQESLTNIMRHADANDVRVDLEEKDGKLFLQIKDNGKGIEEEKLTGLKSLGILGMRERARQIGGELQIFRGEENGTTVLLSVPIA